MNRKKKVELDPDLEDRQSFQYSIHGMKSSTDKQQHSQYSLASPQNYYGSLLSNKRLASVIQPKKIKSGVLKSMEDSIVADDMIEQSHRTDTINPLTMEQTLSEKTIKKIASLAVTNTNNPNVRASNYRRKKGVDLRQIISKQKVNNLVNKFASKIKRNIPSSEPYEFNGFDEGDKNSILNWEAFQPHIVIDNIFGLINIVLVFFLLCISSLALTFKELEETTLLTSVQIFGIFFFMVEIGYTSLTIKYKAGKKLVTLEDILTDYLQSSLIIDLLNLLVLILDVQSNQPIIYFARLFIITKLPQCLDRLEKLEVSFIKNYYNEQYWSLVKVVLFNFCFAHILAIFLSAMAELNPGDNWQKIKGLAGEGWFPKYVWAYYWGVNIMLTVGFGDLSATNHREALCLIFIEIFSVMCLAYNINWIGTLISNIRAQDLEKGKNYKTFKQLSDKYGLPNELQWRISNYIEESVNIRKKFNIEEQRSFISSLPLTMKRDYLKESNKSIFSELPFFSGLIDKTLYQFAEKIEMNISHPEQFLRRIDDDYNLLILRQGQIGYTVKKSNCGFNEMIIDRVKVNQKDKPFIMGLEFLTRTRPKYETKSIQYSVIYSLNYDDLINILKDSQMDYLLFCLLRDRNRSIPDEFQVLSCQICKDGKKHTKFSCPKLHFAPLSEMVIHKYNYNSKFSQNKRITDKQLRIQTPKYNTLAFNQILLEQLQQVPCVHENSVSNNKSKINNHNPFINKIKQMKKLRDTLEYDNISEKIPNWIVKATSETIKKQLQKLLKPDTAEDQVWTIGSDKAKNYKEYFPYSNSCNLEFLIKPKISENSSSRKTGGNTFKIGSFRLGMSSGQLEKQQSSYENRSSRSD